MNPINVGVGVFNISVAFLILTSGKLDRVEIFLGLINMSLGIFNIIFGLMS